MRCLCSSRLHAFTCLWFSHAHSCYHCDLGLLIWKAVVLFPRHPEYLIVWPTSGLKASWRPECERRLTGELAVLGLSQRCGFSGHINKSFLVAVTSVNGIAPNRMSQLTISPPYKNWQVTVVWLIIRFRAATNDYCHYRSAVWSIKCQKMVENVDHCFPKPTLTLFCPQPKDIQFTVIEDERDQKIFTEIRWFRHFFLKNEKWINRK